MTPLHHHSHHHGGPVPASVVHAAHHGHLPFHIPTTAGAFIILVAAIVVAYLLYKVIPDGPRVRRPRRPSRRQPQSRYSDGY